MHIWSTTLQSSFHNFHPSLSCPMGTTLLWKLLKSAPKSSVHLARSSTFPLIRRRTSPRVPAHAPRPGRFSDYLKMAPIEGKGLGVVAARDIDPCTLLLAEPPVGIILEGSTLSETNRNILGVCCQMDPETRGRFLPLHEAPNQFVSKEASIWKTNFFR